MKPRRLYGELGELTDEGRNVFEAFVQEAAMFINEMFVAKGVDLRDARQVIGDALNTAFAARITAEAAKHPAAVKARAEEIRKRGVA